MAVLCAAAVSAAAGDRQGAWRCVDDRGESFAIEIAAGMPRVTRGTAAPAPGRDVIVANGAIEWTEKTAGTPRRHRFVSASGQHSVTQFIELVGRDVVARATCARKSDSARVSIRTSWSGGCAPPERGLQARRP